MCARCACLLYGNQYQRGAVSNKHTGPPIDIADLVLVDADGEPITNAQPPFLLRYSPQLFAREAPEMFGYEVKTNRLFLQPNQTAPWLRPPHGRHTDRNHDCTWLYCSDCSNLLFNGDARNQQWRQPSRQNPKHIPFRDRGSIGKLKPMFRNQTHLHSEGGPRATPEELAFMREDMEADAAADFDFPAISGISQEAHLEASREEEQTDESGAEDLETDGEDANMEAPLGHPEAVDPVDHNMREKTRKYSAGWKKKLRHHSRQVPGPARDFAFGSDNLVPKPDPDMWQDAPHLPFDELKSTEAQNRLSACRPISGMREAGVVGGVPTYAHNTGEVNMRRRATMQVASTLGFVLNQRGGKFMGITPAETEAVHEIITWFRIPGHNAVLRIYGTLHEKLQGALGKFKAVMQGIIPEGHPRARVRLDRRHSRKPREAELGSTLERERTGLVVIDHSGQPMNYQGLDTLTAAVATQDVIISADVPGPGGKGWQRSPGSVALEDLPELTQEWRENLVNGAQVLMEETYVPANDPHYDAKVWPCVHPYGTGSLLSERGSGGTQAFARNRLTQPQSWFRRSALWGFWMLDRLHKTALFFQKKRMSKAGRDEDDADQDPYHKHFGTAQPANIPESTAWWKRQTRDLFAMSDDAEMGLMSTMVTITHNDNCPEMLAVIRRGPFATPTEDEMLECYLGIKPPNSKRPDAEHYALEHVLSYQRRVKAVKDEFMPRNKRGPLGWVADWWDRTEAQVRAALHAHILMWFRRRDRSAYPSYNPIGIVQRDPNNPGWES